MSHRFMPLSGFLCFLPSSACTRGLSLSLSLPSSIYIYFALFLLMYVVGCIISFLFWAKFVLPIGMFDLFLITVRCDDDSPKKSRTCTVFPELRICPLCVQREQGLLRSHTSRCQSKFGEEVEPYPSSLVWPSLENTRFMCVCACF